jgi:hypothetical protein
VGVWGAVLLAALSLAGCSRSLADLFGQDPGEDVPPPIEAGDTFTVTYKAGNGNGDPVVVTPDSKGEITLPGPDDLDGFAPKTDTMVFAGWHDGTFTYAAGHEYTVTRNVPLEARWGFTTLEDVTKYLGDPPPANPNDPILLVVCDGGDITLDALAGIIQSTPKVELDLSALSLDTVDLSSFTNAIVAPKLILPRTATATTGQYAGTALLEVSGLKVTSIGDTAFFQCTSLTKANFPKVTTIGIYAFFGCTSLTTADLPMAETIGTCAFLGCALTKADFPVATTIDSNAFNGCSKLVTANFPKAETIGVYAFHNCTNLETITIGGACNNITASSENDDPISDGFKTAYENAPAPKAGTYTRDAANASYTWTKTSD